MPCTSFNSQRAICSTLTFLNEVPISRKDPIIESFSFKYSRLGKISPVTYREWHVVSTRNSNLFKLLSSVTSIPPKALAKNFSFRSITSSTCSSFIISKNWSYMLVILASFSLSWLPLCDLLRELLRCLPESGREILFLSNWPISILSKGSRLFKSPPSELRSSARLESSFY